MNIKKLSITDGKLELILENAGQVTTITSEEVTVDVAIDTENVDTSTPKKITGRGTNPKAKTTPKQPKTPAKVEDDNKTTEDTPESAKEPEQTSGVQQQGNMFTAPN